LFVVNTALLCAHVEPVPYYGQLLETEWEAELVAPQIYTELLVEGGKRCNGSISM